MEVDHNSVGFHHNSVGVNHNSIEVESSLGGLLVLVVISVIILIFNHNSVGSTIIV